MLRHRRVVLGICFALILGSSGCRDEKPPANEEELFRRAVQGTSAVEDRHLQLMISGAINLDFRGTHKMQFFSRPYGPREESLNRPGLSSLKQASVATVSTRTPFEYSSGRGVVVGISVVGEYTGAGKYIVKKRNLDALTPGPPGTGANLSIVRLELFDMSQDPPVSIDRIDTDEEPCHVTLRDDAKAGDLLCPLITDSDGSRHVKVTMSWGPVR